MAGPILPFPVPIEPGALAKNSMVIADIPFFTTSKRMLVSGIIAKMIQATDIIVTNLLTYILFSIVLT